MIFGRHYWYQQYHRIWKDIEQSLIGRPHAGPWAWRWMEDLDPGAVARARGCRVTDIAIRDGYVTTFAEDPETYCDVDIKIGEIDGSSWTKVARSLPVHPSVASALLAGRMPDDIENLFKNTGLPLLPHRSDMEIGYTCGEGPGMCRHAMTVFVLLAEEIELDPFLLFELRGCDTDKLAREAGFSPDLIESPNWGYEYEPDWDRDPDMKATEQLPEDHDVFWGRKTGPCDPGDAFVPAVHAALPRQLGRFPFWAGSGDFVGIMERIYRDASRTGMGVFRGEPGSEV